MTKTKTLPLFGPLFGALLVLASCAGSNETASSISSSPGNTSASVAAEVGALPTPCVLPPYTANVARDGTKAAGSATYSVVGAAALPIPLVPDRDNTMADDESLKLGETTPLVMYNLIFGDEPISTDEISIFGGYTPSAGKTRGFISIAPSSPTVPLKVGDVVKPGSADGLNMFTTLSLVGLDFKAEPDELTAYLEQAVGSVTILALTDQALCLDVNLSWSYSDFGSETLGTLTIKGTFAAPLAARERYPLV